MKHTRMLALLAAVLLSLSVAFPFWTARMQAPTYPEGDLLLNLFAYRYGGDVDEWNRVGRLGGVHVPPPIPDAFFVRFPAAILGMSLLAVAAAAKERLLTAAAPAPWVLMVGVAMWGQYSLYLFGHNLDPDRPLKFLQPFTPPIVGIVTLGKIVMYQYPDIGSIFFAAGSLLLVVCAWRTGKLPVPFRGKLVLAARS